MRVLIALAFLAGCDDTGGNGFLPSDALLSGDGPALCQNHDGMTPEDWVDPGELARAEDAGSRGCFIDQRLVTIVGNRCIRGGGFTVFDADTILRTCEAQNSDFRANGRAECFDLWASGTCNEIADNTGGPPGAAGGCSLNLARFRAEGRLACP